MSLGFIVPAITNSKVLPDKSLSRSSTPAVRTAQFGDGYQQRVADGLNSIAESYSVSFANRGKSVADDIISFIVGTTLELSGAKNFTTGTALTFTNPNEKTVKVVCATWQQTYTELLGSSVTATFDRVYEP